MKIKFKDPPSVSQADDGNDDVLILFWGAPQLRSSEDKQIYAYSQIKRVSIPPQNKLTGFTAALG